MKNLPTEMSAAEYRAMVDRQQGLSVPDSTAPKRSQSDGPTESWQAFDDYLCLGAYGDVIHEHQFHPTRRWRFDWFLPDHNVAFEYDGLMSGQASHASINNILRDSEKGNEAQAMGIRVFRVNAKSIQDGSAFTLADRVLRGETS